MRPMTFTIDNLKLLIIILTITLSLKLTAQDLTKKWLDSISGYTDFKEINIQQFNNWNFENILSNLIRYENDPISTYIGFFGPKFRSRYCSDPLQYTRRGTSH